MRKKPLLSIIIPAYNEERDIGKCLKSLENQSYKKFEIIVVDDGSTDKTREIVKNFKKIKLLKQKHKGPGEARNFGAKNARGEILILLDADMILDKDYLKYLIKPILKEGAIGTEEGLHLVNNLDSIWSRCWGKVLTADENRKEDYIFRAIRKKDFMRMGGFDPKYGYADDKTFWFKYGVKSKVAKKAICYHKNPETLKDVYNQSRWIGSSVDNIWFKIPILRYFAPIFLIFLSPAAILFLSLKKCYRNKNFKIFLPYMLVFMTVRYFGSIKGIINSLYFSKNVR